MTHFYYLLASFLFVLLSGCGAVRKSIDYDYSLETDIGEVKSLSVDSDYNVTRDMSLVDFQIDTAAWTAEITWWTPPDSVGKQYPSKTANINYESASINGHRARDSLQSQSSVNIDKSHKTNTKTEELQSNEEVTAKKPPWYHWVWAFVIIAVCVGLVYMYKKKNK